MGRVHIFRSKPQARLPHLVGIAGVAQSQFGVEGSPVLGILDPNSWLSRPPLGESPNFDLQKLDFDLFSGFGKREENLRD
jgi:hypothetical protein